MMNLVDRVSQWYQMMETRLLSHRSTGFVGDSQYSSHVSSPDVYMTTPVDEVASLGGLDMGRVEAYFGTDSSEEDR